MSWKGIGSDVALAIADGMTVRADDLPGWDLGDDGDGLSVVEEGWLTWSGRRDVCWASSSSSTFTQLSVVVGDPTLLARTLSPDATFTTVGGVVALASPYADGMTKLTWRRQDGVGLELFVEGSAEDARRIAESVVSVDQATWDVRTTPSIDGESWRCDSGM